MSKHRELIKEIRAWLDDKEEVGVDQIGEAILLLCQSMFQLEADEKALRKVLNLAITSTNHAEDYLEEWDIIEETAKQTLGE